MLGKSTVMAMIAVSDQAKGVEFYEKTLGLKKAFETKAGVGYKCGDGYVVVYESKTAGHNEATSATWEVDDIDAAIDQLHANGVAFEQFDFPGATYKGHVLIMDNGMKAAWFRDPDGNILGLAYRPK